MHILTDKGKYIASKIRDLGFFSLIVLLNITSISKASPCSKMKTFFHFLLLHLTAIALSIAGFRKEGREVLYGYFCQEMHKSFNCIVFARIQSHGHFWLQGNLGTAVFIPGWLRVERIWQLLRKKDWENISSLCPHWRPLLVMVIRRSCNRLNHRLSSFSYKGSYCGHTVYVAVM